MSETMVTAEGQMFERIATQDDEISALRQKHDDLANYVGNNFAEMEQRFHESFKHSEAYKALVAELEMLKREQKKQREDHQKLWQWVKKLDFRLIRKDRDEPEAKAKETSNA